MKHLNTELTDWKFTGFNYWRYDISSTMAYIGLRSGNDGYYYPQFCIRSCVEGRLNSILNNIFSDRKYKLSELDQAKQDIDNFIIKTNKLNLFT